MTPAERDEARLFAQLVLDAPESSLHERTISRAVLRYVPAGDATHVSVAILDVEHDLPPAFRRSIELFGLPRFQPDDARAIAHALHAAADAAEES